MKAITLWQPWASLVAEGAKWIETRGRRSPWHCAVGETIAIHAAQRPMRDARDCHGVLDCFCPGEEGLSFSTWDGESGQICGPYEIAEACSIHGALVSEVAGCVLATARLDAVLPITNRDRGPHVVGDRVVDVTGGGMANLWLCTSERNDEIEDQRPFGDFTPGRWALLLSEIHKLPEPDPVRGAQGLWQWEGR